MSSSKLKSTTPPPTRRRAGNSVISLTQFAHAKSKGTRKAIENYKQKQKSKFNRNAALLREYRKVMKSEGYEAGKGASRKRSWNDDGDDNKDNNDKIRDDDGDDVHVDNSNNRKKRRHKADPLAKAKEMAKQSKEDKEHKKEMKIKEQKENEKRIKQKQIRSRKLGKRTSRGQPVMKHVVGDLLDKIKKSV